MKYNEEDPDDLGRLGDTLLIDVLKKVNKLLEQVHQADKEHQGSTVIIYAPGSQYVEKQYILGTHPHPPTASPQPSPKGKGDEGEMLPEALRTEDAMVLWKKVQQAGYVDKHYQPLLSRTQAALLADAMAERLGIKEKWKVFEGLWNRRYMRSDYNLALSQQQSYEFQDELKRLFG